MGNSQDNGRVFVIANHWEWKWLAILSLLIRIVGYGWNHVAREHNGVVYEMVGCKFSWIVKRFLGKQVSYAPNEGSGWTVTPLEEWLKKTKRKVIVLEALVPLVNRKRCAGYAFLDLPQILLHIIRTKWLLIGHSWNGTSGTRLWKGEFCTEGVGLDYGLQDAHTMAPIDYLMRPNAFRKVAEITTAKNKLTYSSYHFFFADEKLPEPNRLAPRLAQQ